MSKILLYFSCLMVVITNMSCSSFGEKTVQGSLKKQKVSYDEPLLVQGSMEANELRVKKLTVQGSATLGNSYGVESVIDGDLLVQGQLSAQNLTINGKTTVQGDAELTNCKLGKELIIKENGVLSTTEVVGDIIVKSKKITLKTGVTVRGSITFENEKGQVLIKGHGIRLEQGIINGEAITADGKGPGTGPLNF